MNNFKDLFKSWQDVQKEYETKENEPEEILLAYYGYESYSGSSIVIYRNNSSYSVVQGGHCSCHGLEGQWEPIEYNKNLLIEVLKRQKFYESEIQQEVNKVIQKLQTQEERE